MGSEKLMVRVFGATDKGLMRSRNEDTFLIADLTAGLRRANGSEMQASSTGRGLLLAVSDGMGGRPAGQVASAVSVDALFDGLRKRGLTGSDVVRLRRSVERANRKVLQASRVRGRRGMGATLTAAWVRGRYASIAQVGDSRAYLLRNGKARLLTRDQSFAQELVDAGALTIEQAEQSPQKHILTQAMGQPGGLEVELRRHELRPGDRLLLCSDGLSNMLPVEALAALGSGPRSPREACLILIDAANQAGGDDNITVVIAEMQEPPG